MSTVKMLFAASRPLSWINTAYPFSLVLWLLTRQVDATLVVGTLFFLIPYNLAMYGINDVFDHESDLLNPRKGGVEGALVPRRQHHTVLIAVVVTTVPWAVALAVLAGPAAAVVLAVVLFAVVAYSAPHLRFKEIPFLDSATSATHFVGPALVGLAAAAPSTSTPLASREVVAPLVAFFLWGMASQAFGAVQDVIPDRERGWDRWPRRSAPGRRCASRPPGTPWRPCCSSSREARPDGWHPCAWSTRSPSCPGGT
ncbi:prenyltransferase [Actinomyces polynesiensis]|uniref:prenyltransferase n=1 Tax=Actinomyces polynesiensis TaxID=1325934 RepID=UPI0018CE1B1C|nr:prenyltransferase [Actinomyces polynesiensis]